MNMECYLVKFIRAVMRLEQGIKGKNAMFFVSDALDSRRLGSKRGLYCLGRLDGRSVTPAETSKLDKCQRIK